MAGRSPSASASRSPRRRRRRSVSTSSSASSSGSSLPRRRSHRRSVSSSSSRSSSRDSHKDRRERQRRNSSRSYSPRRRSRSRNGSRQHNRRYSNIPPAIEQKRRLLVKNLSNNVTEAHIREIFSAFAPVERVQIEGVDRATVDFQNYSGAEKAQAHLHGGEVDGRVIVVNMAMPERHSRDSDSGTRRPSDRFDDRRRDTRENFRSRNRR